MADVLRYKCYLIRWYGNAHGMNAKQTFDLFLENSVLDYIEDCYDVLHTTGLDETVHDIDEFLKSRSL